MPQINIDLQIAEIPLSEVTAQQYTALWTAFDGELWELEAELPGLTLLRGVPGSLICLSDGNATVGFALIFGGPQFRELHLPLLSRLQDFWFIRELSIIGNFCFIKFLGISQGYRKQGLAGKLLRRIEAHPIGRDASLIGTVVHEDNYPAVRLMHDLQYQFIDHYRIQKQKALRYRVIKIRDQKAFARSINSDSLYHASGTIIPIQLNLASQNINNVIGRMGAKLTWTTFFQLSPMLTREFGMKKVHNGYYHTLLTEQPAQFRKGVATLREALDYFEKKEIDGITTISSMLIRNVGLKFFIMNDEPDAEAFPSFVDPLLLNLQSVDPQALSSIPQFGIGDSLENEERQEWEDWIELHRKLCHTDLCEFDGDGIWVHAVIPLSYSGGVSGLMFSFILKKEANSRYQLNDIASLIINACSQPMLSIIIKARDYGLRKLRMHSAVSTIMTRNLSHNIGSHVLSNLYSTGGPGTSEQGPVDAPSMERFASYLRTRMDFLADIATSLPVAASSHGLHKELIRKFRRQEIILRFISGTHLRQIRINFENKARPGIDAAVQIPNGAIGAHAMFVIFENLIRNCAKHESLHLGAIDTLALHLSVEGITECQQYYRIVIRDDLVRNRQAYEHLDGPLAEHLNAHYVYPPLFDRDLEIRSTGWGFLEMKIAAAYLRKVPPVHIDREFLLSIDPRGGSSHQCG